MGKAIRAAVPVDRIFAANVEVARRARLLSQAAFILKLRERGLSLPNNGVTKISRGIRTVSIGEAVVICDVLAVSLEAMTNAPLQVALS